MDLKRIEELVRPVVETIGCTLYDIEFVGRTLRISIQKPGGVSLDDCTQVSRLVNPLLDVEEVVPGGAYDLQVSSPGLDRVLRRPEHFAESIGEVIRVSTTSDMAEWNPGELIFRNRRKAKGKLLAFEEEVLSLDVDGKVAKIPFQGVKSAQVEFVYEKSLKKGKKNNNG